MKKTLKRNLIAASVAAALAAGAGVAVAGTKGTTNLLFPFFTTATGSYTFLTVALQNPGVPASGNLPVHFTYAYKATTAANSVGCGHIDGDATMTANDLMMMEVRDQVDMSAVFGDTTSKPKYFPNTAASANQQGFIIVNNASGSVYGSGAVYESGMLYGEARIINTVSGLAMGYSTDDLHTTTSPNPDFSTSAAPDGQFDVKVTTLFPSPTVSTNWYILPMGTEQAMAFVNAGGVSAIYQLQSSSAVQSTQGAPGGSPTVGIAGQYNNNETFQSSTATASVVCFGVVDQPTLLGALNATFTANGGWANFVPVTSTAGTTGASQPTLLYKEETTTALGGTLSFITREPTM